MLADNRDVIADILAGLGEKGYILRYTARGGADTLRWCAEFDATPAGTEADELERLREFVEALEDVLNRDRVGDRREHPADKVKAIREAYAGALV